MPNNKEAARKLIPASIMSEEERTPQTLKFSDPDFTVVVGEGNNAVEFYHYKHLLAAACPYFDDMFSSGMKESKENKVNFPDKDPDSWLIVYRCLVSLTDGMLVGDISSLIRRFVREEGEMMELLSWLDFLGVTTLARHLDEITATQIHNYFVEESYYPSHEHWSQWKYHPCPLIKKVLKEHFKRRLEWIIHGDYQASDKENVINYLLDDECGEEIFQFLLSKVTFPDQTLKDLDKETIVSNPLFWSLLVSTGKATEGQPPRSQMIRKIEDIIGKDKN